MKKLFYALPVILLVAAAGLLARQSLSSNCQVEEVKHASGLLVHQLNRFDHDYQFATSASRDSLVRPVNTLQLILMDTRQVPVPACLQKAKEELVDYMGTVIRAFQAYGAQEADGAIRDLLKQSDVHYQNFLSEVEEVDQCAPLCIPSIY